MFAPHGKPAIKANIIDNVLSASKSWVKRYNVDMIQSVEETIVTNHFKRLRESE